MKHKLILIMSIFLAACSAPVQNATTISTDLPTTEIVSTPLPPVEGPDPSYKVAAFYYPWYGNPDQDGQWIHWDQNNHQPPQDIGSDYFPQLGAYSSNDPYMVAQHMAWLRQAGIGVIIVSWWGQNSMEEKPVPLIMEMAERYGIKVAFHIEPYSHRAAPSLVSDIKYLYRKYGDSTAFFRTTSTSRYSPEDQGKGIFFVWCIEFINGCGEQHVDADYWQHALDEIHALPESPLVIANTLQSNWISGGHFDGLYNYVTLHLEQEGGFSWARSLPPDSLYIPSVIPGNSAQRVGYPPNTLVLRNDGSTFHDQWMAALGTGVEPDMVTITSFNEWHEGSMIEPPALGVNDGQGYDYLDFGSLPPDRYLTLSHQWIADFLSRTWPSTYPARIQIKTTSDWTTVNLLSGGSWMRPELISSSETATEADLQGDAFALLQPIEDANLEREVEMTWDILLSGLDPTKTLVLNIDRGNIGHTQVTIFNYLGDAPVEVQTFNWSGVTTGRNRHSIELNAADFIRLTP